MKKKSINKMKITNVYMREQGFIDGYTSKKSEENVWIKRFYKRKINVNLIKEYIDSYITGYNVGKYTALNLESVKIKNGEISYNNNLNANIGENEIKDKIKVLSSKKRNN